MSLDLSTVATDLMTTLGDATYIEIIRPSGGTFNPVTGLTTGETTTPIAVVGVVLNVDDDLIDGTRIRASDKRVMLDKAQTPVMTDKIKFDSIEYTIVQIGGFNHAGIQQYWNLIIRD